MKTEPVALIGAISEFVRTAILLGIAFGLSVSQEQFAAIMIFVGALLAMLQTIFVRRKVSPNENI